MLQIEKLFIYCNEFLTLNTNTILIEFLMKALVEKINANMDAFKVNAEAQVVKGNKAAGARARKAALELMKDLKEFRKISVGEAKK